MKTSASSSFLPYQRDGFYSRIIIVKTPTNNGTRVVLLAVVVLKNPKDIFLSHSLSPKHERKEF
jgi:hypothetical protein